MNPATVVIGGGIGGLACAHRLARDAARTGEDARIIVLEAGARWGGVIATDRRDGFVCERGPDAVLTAKPAAIELMRELGLENRIIGVEPPARRTLIARGRRLVPVPDGLYLLAPGKLWPFATSSAVGWLGKLRMLGDLIAPRRPAHVEEESLAGFVRRRLGRAALERLAQPLVGGIYSADPEDLSVDAAVPQFVAMEKEHRSLILALMRRAREAPAAGARYGLFATLRGGLEELVAALLDRLRAIDLRLGAPVARVTRLGDGWRIALADGSAIAAERVVIAAPAHIAATLLDDVDRALAADLAAIPYADVATVNLAFDATSLPDAAGFVVPAVEHRAITAATFASRKFAHRAPAGAALVRCALGGALRSSRAPAWDDDLSAASLGDLRALLPDPPPDPRFAVVTRWRRALAQPVLGHRARVARIRAAEARVPGLALIGNGYEGSGVPDVIAQAEAAAARLRAPEVALAARGTG